MVCARNAPNFFSFFLLSPSNGMIGTVGVGHIFIVLSEFIAQFFLRGESTTAQHEK